MESPANKILIVEDSRSIRRALKPRLESVCGVEVLLAETYAQAVDIIDTQGPNLFLAILDLTLPDAMHGEMVDYASTHEVPNIVFTSSLDATVRKTILSKGTIDYVVKSSRAVEELVHIVRRLQLNRAIRVLVVDDSRSARISIQSSLALQMFQVSTAENGQDALEMLTHGDPVDLVLTDYEMPGMNGVELVTHLRESFSKEELAIVGVSSTRDDTLAAKFLKSGANDFMRKPLGREEFYCRVLNNIEALEHVRQTEKWTKELKESRDRERNLIDYAPIGIFRSTPKGKFVTINAGLAEMYGYDSPQDLMTSVTDIDAQLYVDSSERGRIVKALAKGPIYGVEVRGRCKDGSTIWVSLSMRAVSDEKGIFVHYEGFVWDITKRKQAEDALKESQEFLQLVMDSVDAGILVIDPQSHTVEAVNAAAAKMFGAPVDDVLGRICHKFLCPAEIGRCPITDLGQEVEHSERILLRVGGGSAHILKSAKRFKVGGTEKLLETFVDISERKEAEAMRDQIERIIQHDLRAPVSSAIYAAQLLREGENLTMDQHQILDSLAASANQMLGTLNLSLELYKVETGQYKFQPEVIDCSDMFHAMVQNMAIGSKSIGNRVEQRSDGKPVPSTFRCLCLGQRNMLQTALQNLLQNALEASPSDTPVLVDLLSLDKDCRIEIMNKGVVPLEIRDRFFDKYVTSGKFKGTGLGTYSARMMVKAQGGDISMRTSDEDNETVITIHLPKPGEQSQSR